MTNRELLRLMVGQVCIHSAMTGTRLAAPLLALQLGYSPAAVGVLLALYALSPLFLALPSGRLADRTGLQSIPSLLLSRSPKNDQRANFVRVAKLVP